MKATLTRTASVLDIGTVGTGSVKFYREADEGETDFLLRHSQSHLLRDLTIDRKTWDELGRPGQVTITIEPDNALDPPE